MVGRSTNDNARGRKREQAVLRSDGIYLYEGGRVEEERRRDITSVRIGSHVKDIPDGTFEGCINLVEVRFDEGALQSIGDYAFSGCKALQHVTIPPSVTKLGTCAFWGCINLTDIHFNVEIRHVRGIFMI